jgi:hypothetical protein
VAKHEKAFAVIGPLIWKTGGWTFVLLIKE